MRRVMTKPEGTDTLPVHAAMRTLLNDNPDGFLDRLARAEEEYRQAVAEARGPDRPTPAPESEAAKDEQAENVEVIIRRLVERMGG
jgi:hypothetical protein